LATLTRVAPGGIQAWNEACVFPFPEAASQSFKAGDLVTLSGGKIQAPVAAGNNLGANDDPVGIALADASGTTNNMLSVYCFIVPTIVRWPVYHGTPASAVTAYAQIGVSYEVRYQTGAIWCIDVGSTTNTKGKILSIHNQDPQNPVGTQYGLVDFIFDPAQCAFPNT